MTRKRHTEEQIIAVLKDAQAGVSVQDLCWKHGISDATFHKWRAKYAGLDVSDVKKLRQREEGNRRLKQMVAEQALRVITAKNWSGPRRRGRRPWMSSHALGSASDRYAG
jgi:putative transposase